MRKFSGYLFNKLFGGAAFGVGVLLIFLLFFFWVAPHISYVFVPMGGQTSFFNAPSLPHNMDFSQLTTEEKIKVSSAIAIASYQRSKEGGNRVIVQEFLKKDPASELTYAVGDEVPDALIHRPLSANLGDGVVIFFVGSPAQTKMTANYANGMIYGLNNISLNDFRRLVAATR